MIIDFSVGNFRSIKEIQSLNMTAANITSRFKEIDDQNVVAANHSWSLLKTKAIYGANASCKSNILRALVVFMAIATDSVKNENTLSLIEPFGFSTDCDNKPAYFQLMFLLNGTFYRYGFEATESEITTEWLFGTPGKKEVQFFLRQNETITINEKHFHEGIKLKDLVRKRTTVNHFIKVI